MESDLVWAPDGRSFVYSSSQAGRFDVYRQQPDSGLPPEPVPTVESQFKAVLSFTPDGRGLVIAAFDPVRRWGLWLVPLGKEAAPTLLMPVEGRDFGAVVSPDGRWLAYNTTDSGRSEVYVTPFPAGGQRTRVSVNGGWNPTWVRGGNELLYGSRQGRDVNVMSVQVGAGTVFTAGAPQPVLSRRDLVTFAATSDGERLLLSVESGDTPPPYISLTLNWTAAMRAR